MKEVKQERAIDALAKGGATVARTADNEDPGFEAILTLIDPNGWQRAPP